MTVSAVRFLGTKPSPPAETCDLCGAGLPDQHDHLVELDSRALRCACRPCALLFSRRGVAAGRYRLVPSGVRRADGFRLTAAEWDRLEIPVGVAFLFVDSRAGRWVAFYPSPAGATESILPLEDWGSVVAANPAVAALEPDVEALLVRAEQGRFEAYLVPIDVCYELVGLVRLYWQGFDGGQEVRESIQQFFAFLETEAEAR